MTGVCLHEDRLWSRQFVWFKAAVAFYVLAIPISHYTLPHGFVWDIALVFLLLMLPPYPVAAWTQGLAARTEFTVALALAVVGGIGYALGALHMIILAIFAHGVWDIAKHKGAGAPFFGWYITGCVLVDWTYAAALMIYVGAA